MPREDLLGVRELAGLVEAKRLAEVDASGSTRTPRSSESGGAPLRIVGPTAAVPVGLSLVAAVIPATAPPTTTASAATTRIMRVRALTEER